MITHIAKTAAVATRASSLVSAFTCVALFARQIGAPALGAQSAANTWNATQVWRVQAGEGAPFGDLRDFVVTPDHTVWLLRFGEQVIHRFDRNGKPLASVGRKGSQQGEFRSANGLVIAGDGSIWVNDPGNARITVFFPSGAFARAHSTKLLGHDVRWDAWLDRRSGEVLDHFFNMSRNNTMSWRRISKTGVVGDTIPMVTPPFEFVPVSSFFEAKKQGGWIRRSYPFLGGGGLVPDGYGGIWSADAESSGAVLIRIGHNDTIARTNIALPRIPVSPRERDEVIARLQHELSAYTTHTFRPARVPTSKSPIVRLSVDEDGRLWLEHAYRFGDSTTTFDVHDHKGTHLGRVRLPRRTVSNSAPVRAIGNNLWVADIDGHGVVSVTHYVFSG